MKARQVNVLAEQEEGLLDFPDHSSESEVVSLTKSSSPPSNYNYPDPTTYTNIQQQQQEQQTTPQYKKVNFTQTGCIISGVIVMGYVVLLGGLIYQGILLKDCLARCTRCPQLSGLPGPSSQPH